MPSSCVYYAVQLLHIQDVAVDCSVLPLDVKSFLSVSVATLMKEHLVSFCEHAPPFNCC